MPPLTILLASSEWPSLDNCREHKQHNASRINGINGILMRVDNCGRVNVNQESTQSPATTITMISYR